MRLNCFLLALIALVGIALPILCFIASHPEIVNKARAFGIAEEIARDPSVSQRARDYASALKGIAFQGDSLLYVVVAGPIVSAMSIIVLIRIVRIGHRSGAR